MDKLNWSLAVDVLLACIVLWKLLQGRQDGMVKKLGSLAALVAAIVAGNLVSRRYAGLVTDVWLGPAMEKLLGHARESLGLEDLVENLAQVLSSARLPDFLKAGVPDRAADLMSGALRATESAVSAASTVVAQRLSGWLLFVASAVLAYAIVKIVFDGILDPVIRRLPIIGGVNRLLGMVLGAIQGALIALLLLWLAVHLVPSLTAPGGVLSPESVQHSFLTRFCFEALPGLFVGVQ